MTFGSLCLLFYLNLLQVRTTSLLRSWLPDQPVCIESTTLVCMLSDVQHIGKKNETQNTEKTWSRKKAGAMYRHASCSEKDSKQKLYVAA